MPKIYQDICKKYVQDMLKKCQRYAQDKPNISPKYARDMPKVSPKYAQDMYVKALPKISPNYAHYLENIPGSQSLSFSSSAISSSFLINSKIPTY